MKNIVVGLILAVPLAACGVQSSVPEAVATVPQDAPALDPALIQNCDALAGAVETTPGTEITRTLGPVEVDLEGASKPGCLVKIAGSFRALGSEDTAHSRIAVFAEDQDWSYDNAYSADGADGTAFAFQTSAGWCSVRGEWDGGDPSDPSHIPDDIYHVTIGCTALPVPAGPQ